MNYLSDVIVVGLL